MNNRTRNLLLKISPKSKTPKELMPSLIEDRDVFVNMTMDAALSLSKSMIKEGVKPAMTELEADIVRRELEGMANFMAILYNEILDDREWGEMRLNSALKSIDLGES